MKKCLVSITFLALLAMFAFGCEETSPQTPASAPTGEEINFRFLISDEENSIGDFAELWIEISKMGLQPGSESGNWTSIMLDPPEEVNLVPLQGDNAQLVWEGSIPAGEYRKVFIHVTNIWWTLNSNGDGATTGQGDGSPEIQVKLPSEKLQIHFDEPFGVSADTVTSFVYDVTVIKAGESGQYIIKPQLDQSGAAQPFNEVPPEGDLEITTTILPDGMVGEEYEAEVEATGGIEPYTWSISDGGLPVGLTLNPGTGEVSGTPTEAREYEFTIQVEDSSEPALSTTEDFSILIEAPTGGEGS